MSAIPSPDRGPIADEPIVCPTCASESLTRGRVSATERTSVDVFACDDCGDFWFERDGARLTPAALRDLGLLA